MGFWAGILIGIFAGEIMGFFMCALLTMGRVEDLNKENAILEDQDRGGA